MNQEKPMEDARIASAQEVLEYLTEVMRGGEDADGKRGDRSASPRMKAAELLGKRLGIFSDAREAPPESPVIIDDIPSDRADPG